VNSHRSIGDDLHNWLLDMEGLVARWQAWLVESQRDLVSGKIDQLPERLNQGERLHSDARRLDQQRSLLLEQTLQAGWSAGSIGEALRYCSPPDAASHQRLENVQWHLRQLRGEQLSLWIGFSQAAELAHSSLQILATGRSAPCTYAVSEGEFLSGGQLVDAEA
jgi:hypothetical protein